MPAEITAKRLNMPEIKTKARALGITPRTMRKAELVHAIQVAEGCTPCFGTSDDQCSHTDCCFIIDCLKTDLQ